MVDHLIQNYSFRDSLQRKLDFSQKAPSSLAHCRLSEDSLYHGTIFDILVYSLDWPALSCFRVAFSTKESFIAKPMFPLILSLPCMKACCGVSFFASNWWKTSSDVVTVSSGSSLGVPLVASRRNDCSSPKRKTTLALNLDFKDLSDATAFAIAAKTSSAGIAMLFFRLLSVCLITYRFLLGRAHDGFIIIPALPDSVHSKA
jgi:hypothetical protein